jgi:hypothetical protein
MTKVTKTEKILRKASSKWDKFLAEGAFKKTLKEFDSDDTYHFDVDKSDYKYSAAEKFKKGDKIKVRSVKKGYATGGIEPEPENVRCKTGTVKGFDGERLIVMLDNGETASINGRNASNKEFQWDNEVMFSCPEEQVNEMTMGERGMQDAQDGNPPSKIGHGNEEYMAAFNAVMQKMGKEPLPIVQPDQAYLDALQRGNLEEQEEDSEDEKKDDNQKEDDGFYKGDFGMELYDIDEAVSGKEQYYLKQQNRAKGAAMALYHEAGGEGTTTPGPFVKSQARIIVDAMVALERMITSDGIDERSADDERDLEEPVKYGSGAELEFDPKAQKFYDRKRDIYLDDEEADALIKETVRKTLSSKKKVKAIKENNPSSFSMRTTHSSDPEMDQVMDIAADMLEMPTRSRGTITLKSVQSALEARSIDSVIENDMLIIDNKYVIAKKELLPKTAQKISFTKYAADYLSNLQGEQQNLPMEEEQARTTMSSDPHLDQIEDYALTVIEKGGNLRQLEDVLNRDGFATFLKGDVLTIDDEFFVGNEENFDISPDEDIRRLTGSNLVAGRTN